MPIDEETIENTAKAICLCIGYDWDEDEDKSICILAARFAALEITGKIVAREPHPHPLGSETMIKVTDEMVEAAYDAHNRHVAGISGYPSLESMRWAIEAAISAHKPEHAGDLCERLRNNPDTDCDIVADQIELLVEALKPFANDESKLTLDHLRKARAVLKSMGVKL